MDKPEQLLEFSKLVIAPPNLNLEELDLPVGNFISVKIRSYRIHKKRICISFDIIKDRTSSELYKNWAIWTTFNLPFLLNGESYRHNWLGCDVYVDNINIGKVIRMDSTSMEYDMVVIQGVLGCYSDFISVPYIKSWFQIDLRKKRIDLNPPAGLLDLNK